MYFSDSLSRREVLGSAGLRSLGHYAAMLFTWSLFACEAPPLREKPPKNSIAQAEEFPWYVGFFRGVGRDKLALLPDGRMIYAPLYLGTYTITENDLTFTSSSGDLIKKGTLRQDKEVVIFSFEGKEAKLTREVSFSRYRAAGTQKEVALSLLLGTWKKVAQAGAPLQDWQKASDALGPSLVSDELLTFSEPDVLTQVVGGLSRQEKFTLENQALLRTPEGVGYQLKQELRLFSEHIELGPKEAPDVYIKQK
jgi:hypothetical protein